MVGNFIFSGLGSLSEYTTTTNSDDGDDDDIGLPLPKPLGENDILQSLRNIIKLLSIILLQNKNIQCLKNQDFFFFTQEAGKTKILMHVCNALASKQNRL